MNWSVIGLIVDIIGAVLLFVSTEILNGIIQELIRTAAHGGARKAGIFSGGGLVYLAERRLEPKKNRANLYAKMGLLLIILGFCFQLIGSLK